MSSAFIQEIWQFEQRLLADMLPDHYGYYLLRLGQIGPRISFEHCAVKNHYDLVSSWHPSLLYQHDSPVIIGDLHDIPIAPNAIDLAVLPHILETSLAYEQILQELWRILIPEGQAFILGINPYSLAGLSCWSTASKRSQFPWMTQSISSSHLRKCLRDIGFDIKCFKTLFFRPKCDTDSWLKRLGFLEIVGQFAWPSFGAIYFLHVQKRMTPLTPIKLNWRKQKAKLATGVVEPTANIHSTADFRIIKDE